jgi:hypothetical protein
VECEADLLSVLFGMPYSAVEETEVLQFPAHGGTATAELKMSLELHFEWTRQTEMETGNNRGGRRRRKACWSGIPTDDHGRSVVSRRTCRVDYD